MRTRLVGGLGVLLLVAAACGNSKSSGGGGGSAELQGVSAKEIRVGGLAAITGPLGGTYKVLFDGVRAYLGMVNDKGGVNGRTIKLVKVRDDATNPSRQVAQARALNTQDKVFAVLGSASPIFTAGRYLADHNVPTFGLNFHPEWSAGPSLFGEKGSFLAFTRPGPFTPFLATKAGATKVGVIAYNVPQSADCLKGMVNSYNKFKLAVVFQDAGLAFGQLNIDAQIQRMKSSGLQFVSTCMDADRGNTLLSRSLAEAALGTVKQYWPNGYSQAILDKFHDLMEGVYFSTFFTPFERADYAPGMQLFLKEMKKRFPGTPINEYSVGGWINADLFVTALRDIGKNVTRSRLVDDINHMKRYTAHGILPGIDWTVQHEDTGPYDCQAILQVQNGKFVSVFGVNGTPFVCFPPNASTLDPIPPPTQVS